jgi:hypothetical protein
MMRTPHFVVLAQTDHQHSVRACRHGIVHLTWTRVTMRFSTEEFQRLAGLLSQIQEEAPLGSIHNGSLRILSRPDEECEIRLGSWVLLLSPAEFREFSKLIKEASQSLQGILASGMWDEPEQEPPSDALKQIRRNPFSKN